MKIEFTVQGEPKGKGRPRFTKAGHTYTPRSTAEYEDMETAPLQQGKTVPLKHGEMFKL